jgi:aryl-alcohol dehydrogenase-like predicted oxidoreductase
LQTINGDRHREIWRGERIMKRRMLGPLNVSAIALGAPIYDKTSDDDVSQLLARAFDLGIDLIDTSDAYQDGEHEKALGRALKDRRSKAILATKFGNTRDKDGKPAVDGRPQYVAEACERSLRHLGVDTIDLYYIHRIDPGVPIEDTVGAMVRLKEQGKIRNLGLSEAAPSTLRRAHAVHPIAALQTEYSLWSREPEDELLDLCGTLGIGFVAYSPLGRGFLSGTMTDADKLRANDMRRNHPRFQPDNIRQNLPLVDRLKRLAAGEGCTTAQLSLAWLLHQRDFIVPVPGTKRSEWLNDNAAAVDIRLSDQTLEALDGIFNRNAIAGDRYPPALLSRVHI